MPTGKIFDQTINGKELYRTRTQQIFDPHRWQKFLIRCLFGFLMGVSDGIPGYSGSTTLAIFGFYRKFMLHARMLVGFNKFRRAMRAFVWLFPFGIFWLIGALVFARFITWISTQGFDVHTATFTNVPFNGQLILFIAFAAISLFSLPVFYYFHKDILFCATFKQYLKPKFLLLPILFLIGFGVIIGLGVYIHCSLTTTIAGHTFKGFMLSNAGYTHLPKALYGKLVYVALVSGFLLFIPGISSSFIMLLFNFYSYTYTIIHDHPLLNIVPIVITVLCCLAGVILNVLLVSFLLKKYPMHFYNLSAGIISGAFITILLSASPSLWAQAHVPANILAIVVVITVVMIINGFIFLCYYKNKKVFTIKHGKFN